MTAMNEKIKGARRISWEDDECDSPSTEARKTLATKNYAVHVNVHDQYY